ncbi:hypothetical protein [Polyangium mundeleinium]|uniref:Lipoprotein n=1 Tax=Polyangium mundeleinium TaxID=2995306 RepID=A0ABT5EWK3_9BACT|nr:hypothetical protein [Polyangium mundeleinium]MDC0746191.1 hypothetical protein [Polyangium mundeleinium]
MSSTPRSPEPRRPGRLLRVALGASFLVPLVFPACLTPGYPLAPSGQVDIRVHVAGSLFAADTLDEAGKPVLPRQQPFETGVTLFLAEGGAPAYGGFVTVRVDPPEALVLGPYPKESDPTCQEIEGAFRCTASSEGYARFVVSSQSDWSGSATLIVNWAEQMKEKDIQILPAGLPDSATNFTMLVAGLDESLDGARVLPTFLALKCTVGPLPDDLGSKWRPGAIRSREAFVRATPPSNAPGVVENAPVIVESLFSEAALSATSDCAERKTRLRVLLGSTGESERFFLCFSDIGGEADFAVTSGQKQLDPGPSVLVDPEPRLLRVRALQSVVGTGAGGEVDLFEVSAFDVNRVRIVMPVDLRIEGNEYLSIGQASVTLDKEPNPATVISATPNYPGTARLHVTPRLLSSPDCASDPISVVEAP